MPRLTSPDYLKYHRQLRLIWLHDQARFAVLAPAEQWKLHAYFVPSKHLTDQQLLAHRGSITWHRPSLPHQAGKALAKLRRGSPIGLSRRRVTARGVVRPEPDIHKLASALKALARHQQFEEHEPPAA